jgi:hypothetical protein
MKVARKSMLALAAVAISTSFAMAQEVHTD